MRVRDPLLLLVIGRALAFAVVIAAANVSKCRAEAGNPPAKCAPPTDRAALVKALLEGYGQGPSAADVVDPDVQVLKEEDEGDHVRRTLSYLVEPGERVHAYLLLPKPLPEAGKRLPLVLCPHPTNMAGKDCVAGRYERPPADEKERQRRLRCQYGLDLVRRGVVCFAPDRAAYGERAPLHHGENYLKQMAAYREGLHKRWPKWNMTLGKAVWDLQRALDFLLKYDFVDPQRTAILGHSLGAWDAMLMGSVDDRVKVVVANAGGTIVFDVPAWTDSAARTRLIDQAATAGMTRLTNLMLMATAPRPFLHLRAINDGYEKGKPNLLEGFRLLVDYYKQVGAKGNRYWQPPVAIYFHATGHGFLPEAKELAYAWLGAQLGVKQAEGNPAASRDRSVSQPPKG